jgi:hypothetical protein
VVKRGLVGQFSARERKAHCVVYENDRTLSSKVVFARRTFDRRRVLQNEANFRSEAGFLLGAAMPTFSLAAGGEA